MRKVIESIVDVETQVENDRLVLDRILTFTDGFVESFEELEPAHVEGGLVHRRIVATVRRDSLLLACGRAESMSVDASGLYPEVMTKLERRRNALALLRKTLAMLPGSLLQVRVERPRVEKLGDTATACGIEFGIRVDPKKYEAFRDRMTRLLPCLSKRDGTVEADGNTVAQAWEPARQQLLKRSSWMPPCGVPATCAWSTWTSRISRTSPARAISGLARGSSTGRGTSVLVKGESDWRWFERRRRR